MKADINHLKQQTANTVVGNMNSPTKAICTQLATTAISQQPVQCPTQVEVFGGMNGGGGNLFNANPRTPCPPVTEAEKATLKSSLALSPMQPETQEGEVAYLNQLRAWQQMNGDNPACYDFKQLENHQQSKSKNHLFRGSMSL